MSSASPVDFHGRKQAEHYSICLAETTLFSQPVLLLVLPYTVCSSTMLIVNKLVVSMIPMPTVIITIQLLFCVILIQVIHVSGVRRLKPLRLEVVGGFWAYCGAFALGMFANMKVLEESTAAVLLMARGFLPVLVCLVEYIFMGRSMPSRRCIIRLFSAPRIAVNFGVAGDLFVHTGRCFLSRVSSLSAGCLCSASAEPRCTPWSKWHGLSSG